MRSSTRWWLVVVLVLLTASSGCGMSRPSGGSADNSRFMEMWDIYSHCSRSEDLEALRADAQRLSLTVGAMGSAVDVIPAANEEPVMGPIARLSADPAAMAAACALRAGQVAQGMERWSLAREMFQMIVKDFPQPRYRYYAAEARAGLEQLDAARSGSLQQVIAF
jgi:hypothetical protein